MDKLQIEVNLTLRETETCLAAADLELFRPQPQSESDPSLLPKDLRRVLAVVSHQYMEEYENHTVIPQREGCLFVMKYKSQSSSELYPHLLFPIDSNLSLSLRQQEALSDAELELSITTPRGSIKLVSKDIQSLYYVLEECRRLQKLSDPYSNLFSAPLEPSEEEAEKELDVLLDEEHGDAEFESHWQWLHFYLNRRFSRILPFIHPKPRDIRYIVNGPDLSDIVGGNPGDEESDLTIIRDHWAHEQLVKRKSEYSKERQLSLRIGNFNVNGKSPIDDLYSWVWGRERSGISEEDSQEASDPSSESSLPDLFVFGFQEVDHSPETLVYTTTASAAKCIAWSDAIIKAMGDISETYTQLTSVQLAGVYIVMFLKKELKEHVSEVSSATAATGFLGFMANKGAAAIRLTLYSSTITFVCSHLAAFDDNAEKRNSDFNELCRKLSFPLQWKGPRASQPAMATIWETDTLFWLGGKDLNYRIDLPDEEIRIHLLNRSDDMDDLLQNDQLLKSKNLEKAFVNFIEGQITFMPTYRFASGLLKDDLGYDIKRRPAWTDRIMYQCADFVPVSQFGYEGHPSITQSDHHPVSAEFRFSVLEIDTKLHHRTMKSIFQSLGDFEDSDDAPNIEFIGTSEIDFGDLSYNKPSTKTLGLKNIGKKACAFRILPEFVESGMLLLLFDICCPLTPEPDKQWLTITPSSELILPGESISIDLTITVNRALAARLNLDSALHDKLILHLLKGEDRTVRITGLYQKSCFANSLSQLVTSKVPARHVENASPHPDKYHLNCPRELMFLVNWLMSHASEHSRLFIESADEGLISAIREYLDTQPLDIATEVPFPDSVAKDKIAYAYSQTLLQFLSSLQDPIIPTGLYPRCAEVQSREDVFEILNDIPGYARTTFITTTSFVHFISQSWKQKEVDLLTKVLANVFFREDERPALGIPILTPLKKREFIRYVIS